MKITAVKCFPVHPGWRKNLVFVKVETDEGIFGWGESFTQSDRDRTIIAQIEELGRYLVGRNPFHIKHAIRMVQVDFSGHRSSQELQAAQSGIEQALWDIVGKATGQPVYNLLGGPCREKLRVYANGWSHGISKPVDIARAAEAVVARGFTALKFYPLPSPSRPYIPKEQEDHAVAVVKAVRTAIGPGVDIMIDIHRQLAPMHAVSLGKRLEEYAPSWIEDVCPTEDLDGMARVRSHVRIPVVAGEAIYSKSGFRAAFEKGAVDIINPDVCSVGGILELKEIGAMAESFFVAVSPHNYNSTVIGLAASAHVSALMPNFTILEYFVSFEEFGRAVCPDPLNPVGSYITLPTRPGLGVEIDEAALARFPYKPFPVRSLRQPKDEMP